jgi:aminomethyltransferase
MATSLLRTPLYQEHLSASARMVPFAGYEMPVQYVGVLDETRCVRTRAGLFDVSHMGQVVIRGGRSAVDRVNRIVTNDFSKVALGQAQYSMLLNHEGGVIDDIILYRRSEEEIFICVNASNRKADVEWMREQLKGVELEDLSDSLSLIALQGPLALEILRAATPHGVAESLKYYWAAETSVFQVPCYLSRTGYTGEDGFEIYLENAHAPQVWKRLLEIGAPHGLMPIGLGARDTLRLEMGYPLHGHEISPTINPFEAGLNWVVKMKKENGFIGHEALTKVLASGPRRALKGFAVEDRRMARQGAKIYTPQKQFVGEVTSGTFSPHLHHPIALGFVDASVANEKDFLLEVRDQFVPMHVHPTPFVKPSVKKNT